MAFRYWASNFFAGEIISSQMPYHKEAVRKAN
jgi:hypothetical protein